MFFAATRKERAVKTLRSIVGFVLLISISSALWGIALELAGKGWSSKNLFLWTLLTSGAMILSPAIAMLERAIEPAITWVERRIAAWFKAKES